MGCVGPIWTLSDEDVVETGPTRDFFISSFIHSFLGFSHPFSTGVTVV